MKATTKGELVTDQQLLEAEEGLSRLLHAKRFPREWIERHAAEVMAQARTDFAARLAAGRDDDTVNLLVVIGYRRALKVLRSQKTGPPTTSIENVFHLADESTPTPEEEAIEHDRQERIVKAMSHLPERERTLLALVYFKGMSIRAAGRKLGWGKSAVDRHHQAALDRLHAMLDRSLLGVEIAIPAFVASRHPSLPRSFTAWMQGAGETIRDAALLGSGRAAPVAESGNAVALSGAGRTAAGVCGAAVVACLAGAATGVVGPGVGALGVEESQPLKTTPIHRQSSPAPFDQGSTLGKVEADAGGSRQGPRGQAPTRPREAAQRSGGTKDQRQAKAASAPAATGRQTTNEFGVESGELEEPTTSAEEPAPTENTPISPSSEPSPPPPAESSGGGSAGGGGTGSEFGM
jgi:RNA polymerase sigma factor (sigma-70 family)